MLNKFSIEKKVAIVIGGTKGIGKGIAIGLSKAGATVVVSSRHQSDCIAAADEICLITGNPTIGIVCDVTDIDSIYNLVHTTINELGKIDILVNSAGVNVRKDSVDFTEKDWDLVQDTQLKGYFFACQAVGKYMQENGVRGKLINVSSIDSLVVSRTNIISYMAAKGAVAQMTKSLAVEWADKGICVNAIAPGYFETEMTKVLFEDAKVREELFENIPVKRFGNPEEDLAPIAVYLASEASDYVTGQNIVVDGGYTLI